MVPNILLIAGDKISSLFFSRIAEELVKKDGSLSLNLLLGHGKEMGLMEEEVLDFIDNADIILIGVSTAEYAEWETFVARKAVERSKHFGFCPVGGSWRKIWFEGAYFWTSFVFVDMQTDISEAKTDFPETTKIIHSGSIRIKAARTIADYLFNEAFAIEALSVEA